MLPLSDDNKNLSYNPEDAPDILIQDLEDVEEDIISEEIDEASFFCSRCEAPVAEGEVYCEQCSKIVSAYPFRKSTGIYVFLTFLFCIFSVLLLGVNSLIANPVLNGDLSLAEGDIESCYAYYSDAYNLSQTLQKNIFADSSLSYFSVGSKTLAKQIIALEKLNGTVAAGDMIKQFFPVTVPKNLKAIKAEYDSIEEFVLEVQKAFSDYSENLGDKNADYSEMSEILEGIIKKSSDTPEYMIEYYRFSLAYSMSNDPSLTCEYLDKVVAVAPDELWLYAGEGISAYKLAGEYTKALSICNNLLKVAPTDTSVIAYTMSVLRLMEKYDEALSVYQSAVTTVASTPELERQRAIILMLQGDTETAETILVNSFSTQGATLPHLATVVVCAFANESTDVFEEHKKLLDGYATFSQVEQFIAGEITIEDIFLSLGGEIY